MASVARVVPFAYSVGRVIETLAMVEACAPTHASSSAHALARAKIFKGIVQGSPGSASVLSWFDFVARTLGESGTFYALPVSSARGLLRFATCVTERKRRRKSACVLRMPRSSHVARWIDWSARRQANKQPGHERCGPHEPDCRRDTQPNNQEGSNHDGRPREIMTRAY